MLDLKHPRAVDALLRLADTADVLLEGLRPGVTERLGVGPEVCLRRNPRLVYARMTGWGQHGPLAPSVGHDIGYIARAGALHALGRAGGPPQFPANLLGDFGGGGMLMAYGICAALVERATSGQGQVVDAAIVDGVASLLAMPLMLMAQDLWRDERGVNLLDGGVPWYDVYETADGKWMAVGALEPRFYDALLAGLGLTGAPGRADPQNWPKLRALLAARFAERTRDEWAATFAGSEACVEPVLSLHEAAEDPHLSARETYVVRDGVIAARARAALFPDAWPAAWPGARAWPAHHRGAHRVGPGGRGRPGRLRRRHPGLISPGTARRLPGCPLIIRGARSGPRRKRKMPMSVQPAGTLPTADPGDPIGVRYPNTARIWNYQLGGKDNFAVDRQASEAANAMVSGLGVPAGADTAVESRHLLQRMVDYMLGQGVRQFLDLGSGLPNMANTHQIATGSRLGRASSTRTSTRWCRPMPPR